MEYFISQVDWVAVTASTLAAFVLGWYWYSDKCLGKKWKKGIGKPVWAAPMWMPMSAQLGSTFLLAIIINMTLVDGLVGHAVLVTFTIAGFIKANGFYSGKTKWAVSIDVLYIIVAAALMIAVQTWL